MFLTGGGFVCLRLGIYGLGSKSNGSDLVRELASIVCGRPDNRRGHRAVTRRLGRWDSAR